jgi:CPA2 family monovalent cation:H+ antiporter-2
MNSHTIFYRDLAYVFVAALVGGSIARKLRQPLIIGYVLAGIVIGPFTPGPTISDVNALELLAEIGVILLMYSIGIEFSLRDLLSVKWVSAIGGPLGILFSIGLALLVGRLVGWKTSQVIAVGAVISVASTMVLSRLLVDRGELNSLHGRVMIGITLVEDLAVVALTIMLPAFSSFTAGHLVSVGIALGKAGLILVPVVFVSAKLFPRLLAKVAETANQELFVLVVLALGFAVAAFTQAIGLSLAVGAFLAGVLVSGSEHSHQTLTQLLPLRDAFVALFFVTVGALIDPRALISSAQVLLAILAMIVLGKLVIWTAVVRLFRYPFRTAVLVAVGLTQIGEFSYVLLRVARNAGMVNQEIYNAVLAASLLTILLNAFAVRFVPAWMERKNVAV